ncbi:MAG: tetratricopeptide repeat protein [Planctomycetota bacterium]
MNKKIFLFFIISLLCGFTVAAEEDADLAGIYYKNGCKFYNDNKLDDAVRMFNKAILYRREYPQAFYKLGECYEKLKNNAESLKNYRLCRQCLLQQPELAKENEPMLGQAEKKIEQLDVNSKQLGKTKNDYTSELFKLANTCLDKKYYNFTERLANLILVIDSNNKDAQEILLKLGKNGPPAETADKPDPKEVGQHMSKGDNLFNAKRYDEALVEYNQVIKLDPNNYEAYNNRASIYCRKRNFDKAIADFDEALRIQPENHRAYCNRGLAYAQKGDLDTAISDFTRSIGLKKNADAYGNRAYAYSLQGYYQKAIADAQMALQVEPDHPSAPRMRKYIAEWRGKR